MKKKMTVRKKTSCYQKFHCFFFYQKENHNPSFAYIILIISSLIYSLPRCYSQSQKIDSLVQVIKSLNTNGTNEETNIEKINALNELAAEYRFSNPDTVLIMTEESIFLSRKIKNKIGLSKALHIKGGALMDKGNYRESLVNYFEALKLLEEAINETDLGKKSPKNQLKSDWGVVLGNIGIAYHNLADYPNTLKYYFKALKIDEELSKSSNKLIAQSGIQGVARHLGNIGLVYYDQGNYHKALDYYSRAVKLNSDLLNQAAKQGSAERIRSHKNLIATWVGNIGLVYLDQSVPNNTQVISKVIKSQNLDTAFNFIFKALELDEELGNKFGIARHLGNIGWAYCIQADLLSDDRSIAKSLTQALEYYFKALELDKELGNKSGISRHLANIGSSYIKTKNYSEAEKFLNQAIGIAYEINELNLIKDHEYNLSILYDLTGRQQLALEHYRKFIAAKDSIASDENAKKQVEQEMQYEFDKKEAVAKAQREKKDLIAFEELEKQKMQRNGFIIGFILMLSLSGVSYYSYQNKKKANTVISKQKEQVEKQKHLVEEKQKEILDSINYAKRIQEAILPSRDSFIQNLKNSFVLYKPKDVVSGDFYWLEKFEGKVLFAAADCTGHGVPGAMVSVICSNALSKSLLEEHITNPGKILDRTRELVIERFVKSGEEVKDGMDISLVSLDYKEQNLPGEQKATLQWSGANNPLWIVSEGRLIEMKPDKQPIGNYAEAKAFTTHSIELQAGDNIYIFTDGFVDQFGGEKGKKFKTANFKNLLLSVQKETMEKQKEILYEAIEKWRGALEQVDDICIIGVQI
jgi:serine phosphatase RsbU (regulator of sigma subunit)/TPR repeat protein